MPPKSENRPVKPTKEVADPVNFRRGAATRKNKRVPKAGIVQKKRELQRAASSGTQSSKSVAEKGK